jgi:NTE family protein
LKNLNFCLWLCCLLGLTGCAFQNQSLVKYDKHAGYRFQNLHTNAVNSDEVFIILSFSGGGTRAAAFSYGAMEELAATPITYGGTKRRLLDEVDVISSVSGGSFTAAYYALYRDRLFKDFDPDFLKKNVQFSLALRVVNPLNWPRLASPYFDRIDMAAECYDTLLFKHHTFSDLTAAGQRPFIVLNATDMSQGCRFEFTQSQFDLLYSDLGTYPLARAVAASSAFPILLSPLTVKNYPNRPDYEEPEWVANGLEDMDNNPTRFRMATITQSYEDATNRPYIHLLDGGISDNIGLRGPTRSLLSTDGGDSILKMINKRQIKKLVVITVNAKPGADLGNDKHKRSPGLLGVLGTVTSAPMDNYSFDTVESLNGQIDQLKKDHQVGVEVKKLLARLCPDAEWDVQTPDLDFYNIELSFERVKDPAIRERLKALPTNYHLKDKDVDLLEQAAKDLLQESDEFNRLVKALN